MAKVMVERVSLQQLVEYVAAQLARGIKIEPETPYIWADHFGVDVFLVKEAIKRQPKHKGNKKGWNIRSLPANRMEYLLENYPADVEIYDLIDQPPGTKQEMAWSREQVLRAMEAAYKAGRRDFAKGD